MRLRAEEAASLREFVASHRFEGDVLDYGCGRQPYADLVARTASYHGFDRAEFPAAVVAEDVGDWALLTRKWDTVLCTQVIQYAPRPPELVACLHGLLAPAGTLVMTGPTTWPLVERHDLVRFTPNGIRRLLTDGGFTVDRCVTRGGLVAEEFVLGWGVVAHR